MIALVRPSLFLFSPRHRSAAEARCDFLPGSGGRHLHILWAVIECSQLQIQQQWWIRRKQQRSQQEVAGADRSHRGVAQLPVFALSGCGKEWTPLPSNKSLKQKLLSFSPDSSLDQVVPTIMGRLSKAGQVAISTLKSSWILRDSAMVSSKSVCPSAAATYWMDWQACPTKLAWLPDNSCWTRL